MPTSAVETLPRAVKVKVTRDELLLDLVDGRRLAVPIAWYPRLAHATAKQRSNFRLTGGGVGIHWPAVDEDLSVEGLLQGSPAMARDAYWKPDAVMRRNRSRRKR
jgi:hypothetical protein